MALFLGIDCGGSSTRAAIADASGQVVGVGSAGASNPRVLSPDAAAAHIRLAVLSAMQQANAEPSSISAAFAGMAGIVGKKEQAVGRKILGIAGLDLSLVPTGLDHDLRIALAGGLIGQEGIVVIVGTGASCYGRRADGASWQSGGWGSILDDGGSAFGLGQAAMRAAVRISDGRLPTSRLLQDVIDALKLEDIRHIVEKVYQDGLTKTEVAALAPIVIDAWQSGDAVATNLVHTEALELAIIIRTTAQRLALVDPAICYTGGLILNAACYRSLVIQNIKGEIPNSKVRPAILEPVLGAVLLAFESKQLGYSSQTLELMRQSYSKLSFDHS